MKKKPVKLEEASTVYGQKKGIVPPATPSPQAIRYAEIEKIRNTNAKLIQVHRVVLEKLAR